MHLFAVLCKMGKPKMQRQGITAFYPRLPENVPVLKKETLIATEKA
jgi:hypothetical protein